MTLDSSQAYFVSRLHRQIAGLCGPRSADGQLPRWQDRHSTRSTCTKLSPASVRRSSAAAVPCQVIRDASTQTVGNRREVGKSLGIWWGRLKHELRPSTPSTALALGLALPLALNITGSFSSGKARQTRLLQRQVDKTAQAITR